MNKYKYIFIILAFRVADDVSMFIKSVNENIQDEYKVIIVNSFYDNESMEKIRKVAFENDCDFIPVENKGYGYGNNRGIEYANQNYKYEYLIICNSDIKIKKFLAYNLEKGVVNAPIIKTLKGKRQNPYFVCYNPLCEKLIYYGHKRRSKFCLFLGQAINKIIREVFLFLFMHSKKRETNVYAAHGSFLILPYDVINRIMPVFDDNMFLYYEEVFFAYKMQKFNIKIKLTKDIEILHYEDGSTKGSNINLSGYGRASYIYFYEKYIKNPWNK